MDRYHIRMEQSKQNRTQRGTHKDTHRDRHTHTHKDPWVTEYLKNF